MPRTFIALVGVLILLLGIMAVGQPTSAATTPGFTEAEVFASNADSSELFGFAVAVDGDTAVVGAPGAAGSNKSGSAYVYTFDGAVWSEQAILQPQAPIVGERFGYDVAIDGGTIVVGARFEGDAGAAYVFSGAGASWTEDIRLTEGEVDDQFGTSVDLEGNRLVVGAPLSDAVALDRGAAHLYENNGGWSKTLTISSPSGNANGLYGDAVLLEGDRVLVGAPIQTAGGFGLAGEVYVHDAIAGTLIESLRPANDGQAFHGFGTSLAYADDVLAIGANGDQGPAGFNTACGNGGNCNPGSVYLFDDQATGFVEFAELFAGDLTSESNFSPGAQFGIEVDIAGDTLLVGARNNDSGGQANAGKAFVFTNDGAGVWLQTAELAPSDGRQGDLAGSAVALAGAPGQSFVIGAPLDDSVNGNATTNEGAFYLFDAPAPTVTCSGQEATIVGTEGDDVLVGTPGNDVINGLAGNDLITGLDGDDVICGGPGADLLDGGAGTDVIEGGNGADLIAGRAGADQLSGNRGQDLLNGGAGGDSIFGNRGEDLLRGGDGSDTLDGGLDVDLCNGGQGANTEVACE